MKSRTLILKYIWDKHLIILNYPVLCLIYDLYISWIGDTLSLFQMHVEEKINHSYFHHFQLNTRVYIRVIVHGTRWPSSQISCLIVSCCCSCEALLLKTVLLNYGRNKARARLNKVVNKTAVPSTVHSRKIKPLSLRVDVSSAPMMISYYDAGEFDATVSML